MILCYLPYWLFSTVFGGIIFFRSGSERVKLCITVSFLSFRIVADWLNVIRLS